MFGVVVGKVHGVVPIANDEELDEAEQGTRVAVAGIALVGDDLLHGLAVIDAKGLQLDLGNRDAVHQEDDIVTVVAVIGVDPQLVDDLEPVLAPVVCIDERIVEWRAILADEGLAVP